MSYIHQFATKYYAVLIGQYGQVIDQGPMRTTKSAADADALHLVLKWS